VENGLPVGCPPLAASMNFRMKAKFQKPFKTTAV